jgi:steroid delta-isomerase-like uncharacterized protein
MFQSASPVYGVSEVKRSDFVTMKAPKQVVTDWVAAFNAHDAAAAAALYHDDAINVQVALDKPACGREEIYKFRAAFFRGFPDNYTTPENLFQDGEGAILEWVGGGTFLGEFNGHTPNGKSFTLCGSGFSTLSLVRFGFSVAISTKRRGTGSSGCQATSVVNESNQSIKPTSPLRDNFSVLATTPCRGLSLSR